MALVCGERTLSVRRGETGAPHTSQLLGCIDEALRDADLELRRVDLLAVLVGPGTFTGLRSGLATVKAFARTLGIPIVPVPTLHAVAVAEARPSVVINAMIPAGREEVFTQKISLSETLEVEAPTAPRHIAPKILLDEFGEEDRDVVWAGDAARRYAALIHARAEQLSISFFDSEDQEAHRAKGTAWRIAAETEIPYAVAGAKLAQVAARRNDVVAADELSALYVRLSDAELKQQCRK